MSAEIIHIGDHRKPVPSPTSYRWSCDLRIWNTDTGVVGSVTDSEIRDDEERGDRLRRIAHELDQLSFFLMQQAEEISASDDGLAISLIEKRLRDAFPGISYEVHGTPKDLDGARALAEADKYQFQWWAVSLVDAIPWGGKKKGADSGIDGLVYSKPDGKRTEKAIVSVKGGVNVNVAMIRDLGHVVDREKAKIGVFVTLAEPTAPMKKEAVKAGFYETEFGRYPKIQILTIADLFAGKKPQMPWLDAAAFKKSKKEDRSMSKQGSLL